MKPDPIASRRFRGVVLTCTTGQPVLADGAKEPTLSTKWFHLVGTVLMVASSLVCHGCSRSKHRFKPVLLMTEADAGRLCRITLEHEDADVRRQAVDRLAHSRYLTRPSVLQTIAVVARLDQSEPVRCTAITALGRQPVPIAIDAILAILGSGPDAPQVRPPTGRVVAVAITVLFTVVRNDGLETDTFADVQETAARILTTEPSRDARLVAAKLLGEFSSREAVVTLVRAMTQRDFGVVYEAEKSLYKLTGRRFDCDPIRWERWYRFIDDPFAGREGTD